MNGSGALVLMLGISVVSCLFSSSRHIVKPTTPIFLIADAFIDDTELEGGQIPPSLRALASVLETVADGHTPIELRQPEDNILRRCASLFRESAEFGDRVSAARGRDVPIMLRTWHKLLMDLPIGGLQVIPGGMYCRCACGMLPRDSCIHVFHARW